MANKTGGWRHNKQFFIASRKAYQRGTHVCELCGIVAWYNAGGRYFCGGHRKEAYAAMLRVSSSSMAVGSK
jgi:hypothetical protein